MVLTTLNRALLRDVARSLWKNMVVGGVIFILLSSVATLWSGAGALGLWPWLAIAILAVPAHLSIIVPAAVLVSVVSVFGRWRSEGAWIGLVAVGVKGRSLLPSVLVLAVMVGVVTAGSTLLGEPSSRRMTSRVLAESFETVSLTPGVSSRFGDLSVVVEPRQSDGRQGVFFSSPSFVGHATDASFTTDEGILWLDLSDGVLLTETQPPVKIEFGFWQKRMSLGTGRRLELDERTTRELLEVARRTEMAGQAAGYEWSVFYKRLVHPLAMIVLIMGALPIGRWQRMWMVSSFVGLGYLVAVRIGDSLAVSLGPLLGASLGLVYALSVALSVWLSWRDR